jgi:hypothetical protein
VPDTVKAQVRQRSAPILKDVSLVSGIRHGWHTGKLGGESTAGSKVASDR